MNIFSDYQAWLNKQGVQSANNYCTRLKRVISEWNKHAVKELTPFETKILPIIFSENSEEYINNILFRLQKYNNNAWEKGEYGKGYHDDINTAINRFGEFARQLCKGKVENKDHALNIRGMVDTHEKENNFNNSRKILSKDSVFFEEFDISDLVSAFVNRTRTRESAFWPARKFSAALSDRGHWVNKFIDSLIVMTECGIHKLTEISGFKIVDDTLYVKPSIYQDNVQQQKSKAKGLAQITEDGFVKAYSYYADGSIHPFKVTYDESGSPIPSISFEHTPAISLIVSKGKYPEIKKLIEDKQPDAKELEKEMSNLLNQMTCILMQRDQNIKKKDAW